MEKGKDTVVPNIDGLHILEVLEFEREQKEIDKYIPEFESDKYHSRKWILNVGMLTK